MRAETIERSLQERGETGYFRNAKHNVTAQCGRQVAVTYSFAVALLSAVGRNDRLRRS